MSELSTVIIAKDTLRALGMKYLLESLFDMESVVFNDFTEGRQSGDFDKYDLIIVDEASCLSNLDYLIPKKNRTVILAGHDMDGHSWQYVNSNADENTIIEALALIIKKLKHENSAQDGLSARETDVLKLVATGLTNKEIADRLHISINTVLTHRKNISAKLGIKSVSGLSVYAMMNGYINS